MLFSRTIPHSDRRKQAMTSMMPMPETVQRALGDAAARDLAMWLEDVVEDNSVDRRELGDMNVRLGKVETRLDAVEQGLREVKTDVRDLRQTMEARFAQVDARFEQMNARFDQMIAQFSLVFDRMISQTRWTIGLIALFGVIISILVAIGQIGPWMR
jgi:hypothetical protein